MALGSSSLDKNYGPYASKISCSSPDPINCCFLCSTMDLLLLSLFDPTTDSSPPSLGVLDDLKEFLAEGPCRFEAIRDRCGRLAAEMTGELISSAPRSPSTTLPGCDTFESYREAGRGPRPGVAGDDGSCLLTVEAEVVAVAFESVELPR